MNNLTSISEYQKIVFVKGLNELSDQLGVGGIAELSKSYPFVVFLTKYPNDTEDNNIDGNYPITNLWFDGQRLTRFLGINKNRNIVQVGDYAIQLVFNDETGLLEICEANTLESISIENCTYIDINGITQTLTELSSLDNPYLIDSYNNKFTLTFKYVSRNNNNINIETINKKLNLYNNSTYFEQDDNPIEENPDSDNKEQDVIFNYKIKKSYIDNSPLQIQYSSIYTNNTNPLGGNFYVSLRLNPIDYNIVIDNQIVNNSITLIKGQTYTISLNFNPSNLTSDTDFIIKTLIETDSDKVLIIGEHENTIMNGLCSFTIKISDEIQANTSITCNLKFTISRSIDNNLPEKYDNEKLNKTISINVYGDQTDKYFYFGYIDPLSEDFDTNLITYYENAGEEIIYKGGLLDNTNVTNEDYFYCVIPTTYINTIKPRWDAYTVNSLEEKEYVDCLNWFNVSYGNKTINGINFTIYKRELPGKFYGKIK